MENSVNKKTKQTKKLPPKRYRYTFKLTEKEQLDFNKILIKYQIKNISRFAVSCVLNQKIKVVVIDQVALEFHASLTGLINHFKALGVSYNILVNRSDLSLDPDSQQILKDIEKTTLELSKLCRVIIDLILDFEKMIICKNSDL
ncbi:hypothetical protein VSP10_13975 [Myroides odoratimimus]|uniref:Mobilization protein n=1 Tax=Myroides odoratimimus CIP 101113 TaxID=883154 RepID=A0AAV3F1N4_9FLAO|nr:MULTISPECIES: hypothetical protein [Myroides]AJA70406.1 hypothetical protein MYRA21_3313 [Myroides sp. A21]EHO09882.1 hypothetical protein HMPREF9715_02247 [Myroides odoratimimus CIP 101113]MEC4053890.1 hypothetical protein [Myroides odoratimimus]